MKKPLLFVLVCLLVCFSAAAIPNPQKNKGSVVGVFYVKMNSDFHGIKKGTYKEGVEIIIENEENGVRVDTHTHPGGYFYFINLKPGTYVVSNWKIELSKDKKFGEPVMDRSMKFTIKPGVITVLGLLKCEVTLDAEAGKPGKPKSTQESKMQKTEKQVNMLVDYFKKLDKRQKWTGYTFE